MYIYLYMNNHLGPDVIYFVGFSPTMTWILSHSMQGPCEDARMAIIHNNYPLVICYIAIENGHL